MSLFFTKYVWEVTSGVLFEKEVGRTSLAINTFLIYEWGHDIKNGVEMEFSAQYRYQNFPQFHRQLNYTQTKTMFYMLLLSLIFND